jgi:OOP family OmpA-OmpF porin
VKLDLLEVRIAELDAWAKSRGQQVLVQVYGHADSQGREDANEQLSRQRADEVVAALVARGINAGNFSPQGKGTRSPGERDGQRYRDDLNRRVTFRVVQPVAGKLR